MDSARRKSQLKRGGNQERVEFCETRIAAPDEDDKLLLVKEALDAASVKKLMRPPCNRISTSLPVVRESGLHLWLHRLDLRG